MTYMAYLLDLAVILFFVLSIVIGCKRGVVKALSRLAGIVAAVVLAFLFCGPLASLTFDRERRCTAEDPEEIFKSWLSALEEERT